MTTKIWTKCKEEKAPEDFCWKKAASKLEVDFNEWCKLVFERAMELETRGDK